jgi:mono/diheme cytochrome c family protein
LTVFFVPLATAQESARPNTDAPSFAEVRAIFVAKCLVCHGNDAKDLKGDYDLRTRDAALKGGESGEAAIVPGQPEKSPLYRAITWQDDAMQMPPKENDRLSAEQVAVVRRWIAAGVKWEEEGPVASGQKPAARGQRPDGKGGDSWKSGSDGIAIATSGGRSADWDVRTYERDAVWAWQPIRKPDVPAASSSSQHPIDAFLLDALHKKGIAGFAPPADETTLLRRVTFDLTGLPPTPHQAKEYRGDYEELIQQLLASPRYGEQQARHWFDVVRYADTAGFSNDFERPNSWRYRD